MRRKAYDLAVLDWGIGGLSVYREILRLCPQLSILYASDSGFTPYGKLQPVELEARLRHLIRGFVAQGIRHVVIACNAASTALPVLRPEFAKEGVTVLGVIEPGIELIRGSRARRVAVIGGRRTIRAGSFARPFRQGRQRVRGRVAQPLSALIEAGRLEGPEMDATLRQILTPLKNSDALLLACTHYPAVAGKIQTLLPSCRLLDPAKLTAKWVKAWRLSATHTRPRYRFVTSGDGQQMKRAAKAAFGIKIAKVEEQRAR